MVNPHEIENLLINFDTPPKQKNTKNLNLSLGIHGGLVQDLLRISKSTMLESPVYKDIDQYTHLILHVLELPTVYVKQKSYFLENKLV